MFASSIISNQALVEDLFNRITPWNLLPKGNTWAPFSGVRFFWRCISFLFWAGWCIVSPNAVLARNHFLVDCKHRTRKIKFRSEKWLFWKNTSRPHQTLKKKVSCLKKHFFRASRFCFCYFSNTGSRLQIFWFSKPQTQSGGSENKKPRPHGQVV